MRAPLRYQFSEFDCGTISLLNAVSFLFNIKEIPAELVKAINTNTLDCFNEQGSCGTTRYAIEKLSTWINDYSATTCFNIKCESYYGDAVTIDLIKSKLQDDNTVIFIRSWLSGYGHYVIVTKIDNDFAYLFDPYYFGEERFDKRPTI